MSFEYGRMWFCRLLQKALNFIKFEKGYVFFLTLALMPVILFGVKYIVDGQSLDKVKLLKSKISNSKQTECVYYKNCAKEAALAVAKKWNPALTYKQQKASMLRIADEVYNKSPTSYDNVLISEAIPGLNLTTKYQLDKSGPYDPSKVKTVEVLELSPEQKQIIYETKTTPLMRYYSQGYYSINYNPFNGFGSMEYTYTEQDLSLFRTIETDSSNGDNEESKLFSDYCLSIPNGPLSSEYWYVTVPSLVKMSNSSGSVEIGNSYYNERLYPDDDTVQIECKSDVIKVVTDNDVGYAIPAECNVDIVLAIPINAAASNANNRDLNTVIAEATYVSGETFPQTEAKSTPIYQISRAYQIFLKNFFYMRGVNVGVIPYSGNVSLAKRDDWIKDPDKFVPEYFLNYDNWITSDSDGKYPLPSIMGSMLYGTKGDTSSLNNLNSLRGYYEYNLLCRGKTMTEQGNTLTKGDLLSTADPKNYKFRKQFPTMCYLTDANLLSMACEGSDKVYYRNPYYILELSPDVTYIYYLLNAFYPYYHNYNQSNFIFIPVTWCNNLLQSWSTTCGNDAVDTITDLTDQGRLSTPSKMKTGRKKALILTVNKPDWFEPGELTYIGFDNDYSDTPAVESDTIRFDIDYSDKNRKYADGSNYDGTIQGQKKILVFTTSTGSVSYTDGYYQCSSATGKLIYPKKYLIKLVVAPKKGAKTSKIEFLDITSDSNSALAGPQIITETKTFYISPSQLSDKFANLSTTDKCMEFSMTNIKLILAEITNRPHTMVDGEPDFGKGFKNPERSIYIDMRKIADDGGFKYQIGDQDCDLLKYGSDASGNVDNLGIEYNVVTEMVEKTLPPTDWKESKINVEHIAGNYWSCIATGDSVFVMVGSAGVAMYSSDCVNWNQSVLPCYGGWYGICYGNGRFLTVSYQGYYAYITESDLIANQEWTFGSNRNLEGTRNVFYADGKFVSFAYRVYLKTCIVYISEEDLLSGSNNWSNKLYLGGDYYEQAAFGEGIFVAVGYECAVYSTNFQYWTEIKSQNLSGGYKGVAYGNGIFVTALRRTNTIAYATKDMIINGEDWIQSKICASGEWDFIAYGHGYFMLMINSGNGSVVYIQEDKILPLVSESNSIRISAMSGGSFYWEGIYCVQNGFVAIGDNCDRVLYFPLPISTAEQKTVPYSSDWYGIAYGDNICLAVGWGMYIGAYITKDNFANDDGWVQINLPHGGGYWREVCFFKGRFFIIGDHYVAYIKSKDLIAGGNWIEKQFPETLGGLSCGERYFVLVHYQSCSYISESDLNAGRDWTTKTMPIPGKDNWHTRWDAITFGGGYFVIMEHSEYPGFNKQAAYIKETELISGNWRLSDILTSGCFFNNVVFSKDKFVSVAETGDTVSYISLSELEHPSLGQSNPVWKEYLLPEKPIDERWTKIVYGGGYFIAYSSIGGFLAYIQEDDLGNKDWTLHSMLSHGRWRDACYIEDLHKFVLLDNSGPWIACCDILKTVEEDISPASWLPWQLRSNSTNGKDSINHHFVMTHPSDMYFVTNVDILEGFKFDLGITYYNLYQTIRNMDASETNSALSEYLGAGIYRMTRPLDKMYKDGDFDIYDYKWEIKDLFDDRVAIMYAGVTLPVNITLYYGSNGSFDHSYNWQSDSSGVITTLDPTEAVKKVTKDACAKLKEDWGDDIRIYLIKFRAQDKYLKKITGIEQDFDYSYLNNCATSTSTPYMYDINTEEQLKNALSEIAKDIKEWSNAKEATNLTNF